MGTHVGSVSGRRLATVGMAAVLALGVGALVTPGAAGAVTRAGRSPRAVHVAAPRVLAGLSQATRRAEPRTVGSTTFTVTVTTDSPLATATSTTCTDAASGKCSLRAAVQAANNLEKPVVIRLGAHIYTLTDTADGALLITNRAGTTIQGAAEATTVVKGGTGFDAGLVLVENEIGSSSANALLADLTLTGGDAASDGGGLDVVGDNTATVLDHVAVTHDTATEGGGVGCQSASLWLTDSSVSDDTAAEGGGGLYVTYCNTYLRDTSVDDDAVTTYSSSMYGGGIDEDYGNTQLVGGSVGGDRVGSATEPGYGGGIANYYVDETMVGTRVADDTAHGDGGGGGEFLEYGVLDATGSTFDGDAAKGASSFGGGLALYYGAHVALHASTVSDDSTTSTNLYGAGGGVWIYGEESPENLAVDDHSAITDNKTGAVVVYGYEGGADVAITDSTVSGNSNTLEGAGGIFVYASSGGATVSLTGDHLEGNHDSGGYSAGAVDVYAYEYAVVSLYVDGSLFKGNVASGEDGSGAIGAYVDEWSSTDLTVSGTQLLGNHAPDLGLGGAIGIYSDTGDNDAQLNLAGDRIAGNVAGTANTTEYGRGGGVYAYDYVQTNMLDTTVIGNEALGSGVDSGMGGGVFDEGYVGSTYQGSTIEGNHATGAASSGGGLFLEPYYGGTRVVQSTVAGNFATDGAGIYLTDYQASVLQSTIWDNVAGGGSVAGFGGGIDDDGAILSVVNSTITANRALSAGSTKGEGGGLGLAESDAVLYYTTVSGNVAATGAGVDVDKYGFGTTRDSIIATNHPSPTAKANADCHVFEKDNQLTSLGGNVLSGASCVAALTPTDVLTARPGVLPLAGNGGPTRTMALATTSPAIDAAHGDCVATDQRGVLRPTTGRCDAGAFQLVVHPHPHKRH